jgi:hypothetical protein
MLGYEVTVVDLRPYALRHPNLRALQGDVRTCAGLEPPYRAVTSISVVEHAGIGRYGEPAKASEPRELVSRMGDLAAADADVLLTVPFGAAHVPGPGDRSRETGRPTGMRVFDRAMLHDLTQGCTVAELLTFGLREGHWLPLAPEAVEALPPRRYATGVAFLRLRKPPCAT